MGNQVVRNGLDDFKMVILLPSYSISHLSFVPLKQVSITDSHHIGLLVISHPGKTTSHKTSGSIVNYHLSVIAALITPSKRDDRWVCP